MSCKCIRALCACCLYGWEGGRWICGIPGVGLWNGWGVVILHTGYQIIYVRYLQDDVSLAISTTVCVVVRE